MTPLKLIDADVVAEYLRVLDDEAASDHERMSALDDLRAALDLLDDDGARMRHINACVTACAWMTDPEKTVTFMRLFVQKAVSLYRMRRATYVFSSRTAHELKEMIEMAPKLGVLNDG